MVCDLLCADIVVDNQSCITSVSLSTVGLGNSH
jgi:hypothetical protein